MLNSFKSKNFYLYLLAQTLSAASAQSAEPNPIPLQTYRAHIPQTNQSCEAEAQSMAARFLGATKVDFARGNCVEVYQTNTPNGKRTVYSIEVSYPRELALDPASSVYGVGDLSWDMTGKFSGLYLDYDSCVTDLALRTAEYRQHTGLAPVAAFCERSSTTADYVMQVDGFGKPQQTLYVFAPDRIEVPTDATVVSDVKALISRMGAQLVAEQGSRLFYYSEKSIHLRGSSMAYFDNPKYCQEQLSEAQKIFTNKDAVLASVHCVATTDILIPSVVELAVIYSSIESPTSFEGREIYPSFEECRLDHDQALAREAREHPFVVGGLCRPSEDDHYVMVIYQNRFGERLNNERQRDPNEFSHAVTMAQ